MPMPVDAGAGNREQQELPLAAAPTYEPIVYSMPTPTHIIIPSDVMQQSSQGADLQLYEVNPVAPQLQGPDPACQGQGDLVASRAIPLVYADRKHRLSTASGDDDSHLVRVYKVLGRVSSSMDIGADVAQSPMLVTVARNGSITSETSSMPRRSEENGSSAFQSAMGVMPSLRSPPVMSLVSRQRTDTSSRLRSPTSQGDDSFTTARLFTGTASPKGFVAKASSNNPFEMAGKTAGADVRRRRDSDVSDIAMRRHLIVDENNTATVGANLDRSRANSVYSDFELPAAANRTFSEWLLAQKATGQSSPKQQAAGAATTIVQAVTRSPSAVSASRRRRKSSSDGSPRVQSYQRHYYPPVSHVLQAVPDDPLHGPNEKQALSVLQARVSDLETRFTCMEALLASVEDELSELAVTPRTLGRLRRAASATRLPAGVRPVVGAVTLAPSVAGLQSQAELTSSSLVSSAYGPGDEVSDDADREDTVVAVQTTAAALAELVAKSRKEFDEATNNALSSISALVNGMQTMRRLDKNLADTANAELSGQTPQSN
ncbi:hypothetical protein GGF42_007718 [Coemansia sp. RSA 2424]|nr:hypothetical protein GGF42_007718 [Coemansia sp. RSA 2424]